MVSANSVLPEPTSRKNHQWWSTDHGVKQTVCVAMVFVLPFVKARRIDQHAQHVSQALYLVVHAHQSRETLLCIRVG